MRCSHNWPRPENTCRLSGRRSELKSADGPKRYLGLLDEFGHGAVSIANPDTARRNAIFVPGTGQDLSRLTFSDDKALAMYTAALDRRPRPGARTMSR